tara:strand:+ start:1569 stop:2225 length:657 start_codon:yes stop_codon:yes gene_type:complete
MHYLNLLQATALIVTALSLSGTHMSGAAIRYAPLAAMDDHAGSGSWRATYLLSLKKAVGKLGIQRPQVLEPAIFGATNNTAAPHLPPIIKGNHLNMTPVRLVSLLHRIANGNHSAAQPGLLYLSRERFSAICADYWASVKTEKAFALPAEYEFLRAILENSPQTDFMPFEQGARLKLEGCVAQASQFLSILLARSIDQRSEEPPLSAQSIRDAFRGCI